MVESRSRKGKRLTDLVLEVMALHGALRDQGERITAPAGLSPARWQLLGAAQGRPMTVSQISRRMGLVRQSVQRVANILVKEGLATFEPNRDHVRSPLLVLTEQGRTVMGQINRTQIRWSNRLARELKMEEIDTAADTLTKFRELLERLDLPDSFFVDEDR